MKQFDFNIIDDWLEYKKLSKQECLQLFTTYRNDNDMSTSGYESIQDVLFSKLKNNLNKNDYHIELGKNATELIQNIFKKHVDDNTLVICSNLEHPNVKEEISKCKNVLILDYNDQILRNNISCVMNNIAKYDKFFIYVIGVDISTGRITPQIFFQHLVEMIDSVGKTAITVIDDVHGMYVVNRDYTLFDYVIGTAHALVRGFDLGLSIQKNKYIGIGYKSTYQLTQYVKLLNIVLTRYDKLMSFTDVMRKFLKVEDIDLYDNVVKNILAIKIQDRKPYCIIDEQMIQRFQNFEVFLEEIDGNSPHIRLRSAQYLTFPFLLKPALYLLLNFFSS